MSSWSPPSQAMTSSPSIAHSIGAERDFNGRASLLPTLCRAVTPNVGRLAPIFPFKSLYFTCVNMTFPLCRAVTTFSSAWHMHQSDWLLSNLRLVGLLPRARPACNFRHAP